MSSMRSLYMIFILFIAIHSSAQKKFTIDYGNSSYQQFIKHPKTEFKDSLSALNYLKSLQITAIKKGYLTASIDSIKFGTNHLSVTFVAGDKFGKMRVTVDPEEARFIRKNSTLNEKFLTNIPFTPIELSSALRKIQSAYLNNGYPFVSMQLIEHEMVDENASCKLKIDRGNEYFWSKIHVKGDSTISEKFISNIIEIKIGELFDESKINKIKTRIDQVPYLKQIKNAELLFTKEGVEIYVYLESVPVSSANGIIGFQPNPISKRLELTGEINLKLQNVLHRGELLDLKWQSVQSQTQSLETRFNYPFLFNTPFGIDLNFDLYKRDTSFLELGATAGVQYFFNQSTFLKAFYRYNSSDILSGGANNYLFSNLGTVKSNSYGLAFQSNRVDYIPNPSRGFNIYIEGSVGTRKSAPLDSIIFTNSLVYRGKVALSYFIPLHRRHVIRLGSQTDFYQADEIYQNEVYRYGGLTSQRGFNEDELFATTKTTATIEYRFLLDKNSHVFAFYDQSWYENNSIDYYNDAPYGFGVGFAFATKLGVFSISYALGKQFNNPVQFSNSKIHFGYIAYF